jgi:hypothetical protein
MRTLACAELPAATPEGGSGSERSGIILCATMPSATLTPSGIGRPRRWIAFGCACAAVMAVKLWLIAPDEVLAQANPYDQLRYADMAFEITEGRWLGDYGPRALIREPSYPVWIALVHGVGIPLRAASEALLLVASLVFGWTLLCIGLPGWFASASVVLLVLQPHSVLANRQLLAAGFYLPMLVLSLSGLLLASRSPRDRSRGLHALWAGLALGVVWTTRPEKAIAVLALVLAGTLALVAARDRGAAWRGAASSAALLVGVATLGITVVSGGYAMTNLWFYGAPVTSDLQAPGYVAANRALLSIEHDLPRRYVPVPADVRARAYAASPSFRELRSFLETPGWGHHASCVSVRVCDDLAGGWFLWIFREAAAASGHMQSAIEADAFFTRIAEEIDAACERGDLRCRPVTLSFLHPHLESWLPSLPGSLVEVGASLVAPRERADPIPGHDDPSATPAVLAHFDAMAGRKPVSGRRIAIHGRVGSQRDPVAQIAVRGGGASGPVVLGAASPGEGGTIERPFDFEFELPRPGSGEGAAVLEVRRESGDARAVALSALIDDEVSVDGLQISASARPVARESLRTWLWNALWSLQPWLLGALVLAGLAGVARLVVYRPALSPADPALAVFVLTGAPAAARMLLLAVIDASSFNATSSRYVYPAAALVSCALLAWVFAAFGAVRDPASR